MYIDDNDDELREVYLDTIKETEPIKGLCAPSPFSGNKKTSKKDYKKEAEYWELMYYKLVVRIKDAIGILD